MRDAFFSFVVNATWQRALTAGLGLLFSRLLRSPRQRFELLAFALVASVIAPALTLVPRGGVGAAPAMELPAVETRAADVVAWLYAAGLVWAGVRLLMAALHARRLAAASIQFRGCMRLSPLVDGPVTIGRTVLLPPFLTGDRRLLAAAAAHEHAHVRRRDSLLHAGLEVVALPLYFHPVVRMLRRAIGEAREMACDEQAAARRGRRRYAEALVRLAARQRTAFAIGMAATPIERRVRALLASRSEAPRRWRAVPALLLFAAAAACSRVDVAPAVRQAPLGGRWSLIAEASDLRAVRPAGYERFTQTIDQKTDRVSVCQQRTAGGRTQEVAWTVITDGVTRPITGVPGARGWARWRDGKLELQRTGPGAHRETAAAFLRDGRLVCEGKTDRAAYHTEFRRVTP